MANLSIIIVSHSADLGTGLVALLQQMTHDEVHIASASGLQDRLGTDATLIYDALLQCPDEGDILLLFDLGSALLSCEMAIEMLPAEFQDRVSIVDAPLVEGAVATAVAASMGEDKDTALRQAQEARDMRKIP
ncbi:dihydroxyacetone kinase phosphoryl donor subunit DhaM [Alicyclobacillus sp. SO9]|uniref:dihydroxyacetone kinase phosphoryl donor subunit DhaM n=1 Tax=Alicyclobacillus sp. SO9 TaxID=2665646 RepID=UPI0018E82209|nr:dihydroxyacetone kinase phosphoryl donor subunit DhaM [Alicyclobacillus sp. SO9]QQE77600.1 PTS-dependent dihydroxyacetone kinase phosphotransferase subunit DhaM [Alicyclobacillus sp. SO9]